jgi:hypothetical protein
MAINFLPPHGQRVSHASTAEPGRILVEDMEELVAAGEALPLMEEFDVGPTFYRGLWWVVPPDQLPRGYDVATEQDQIEFGLLCLFLHHHDEVATAIAARQATDGPRAQTHASPDNTLTRRRLRE